MTTLPERLKELASRMNQDGDKYDAFTLLAEAVQALQAAPEGGWAVDDSMVERAADAYEAAAESEGFGRVEGSERVTHLRFIRAAIDAALQAGTP